VTATTTTANSTASNCTTVTGGNHSTMGNEKEEVDDDANANDAMKVIVFLWERCQITITNINMFPIRTYSQKGTDRCVC
jgi:hypothetical protein